MLFGDLTSSLLAQGVTVRFRASGRSMLPTLREGDCLVIEPVSARDVAVGDVVLYQGRRGPIAHRVAAIERRAGGAARLVLRGDASLEDDAPVDEAQLLGRAVAVERGGRTAPIGRRPPAALRRLRDLSRRLRAALAPLRGALTAPNP